MATKKAKKPVKKAVKKVDGNNLLERFGHSRMENKEIRNGFVNIKLMELLRRIYQRFRQW